MSNHIHSEIESIIVVSGLLGHNAYISNVVKSNKIKGRSIFG